MSRKMEIRITKPKLVSSSLVNKLVLFKNPGPIEEVAMRKAAPSMAGLFLTLIKKVISL
jgi:hypothetical protein